MSFSSGKTTYEGKNPLLFIVFLIFSFVSDTRLLFSPPSLYFYLIVIIIKVIKRLGDEKRKLMHLVPAPAVRLM